MIWLRSVGFGAAERAELARPLWPPSGTPLGPEAMVVKSVTQEKTKQSQLFKFAKRYEWLGRDSRAGGETNLLPGGTRCLNFR
jgi:hypothetical protein